MTCPPAPGQPRGRKINVKEGFDLVSVLIILVALTLLIFTAYRGYSVVIMAPLAAILAVALTDYAQVPQVFNGVFLEAFAAFLKNYFPVFLLGALFGKLAEISGCSSTIAATVTSLIGAKRAIVATVAMCALLTYGGISVFVVVFAVYPFAAALFRDADIPKRLLPATIALGSFSFTMDAFPGSPQIQNIIPTSYFGTTSWAAPTLGFIGGLTVLGLGLAFLDWRRKSLRSEGYGEGHKNEPVGSNDAPKMAPWVAFGPLIVVFLANFLFTRAIPASYGDTAQASLPGMASPISIKVSSIAGVWAVEGALMLGCLFLTLVAFRSIRLKFREGGQVAVAGAMLAAVNTGSEFGFGAVVAALPGFAVVRSGLSAITDPLVSQAVTITSLSAITGSGSGGLSLSLGALGSTFLANGVAAGIPPEVLHRVASMACGGLDTLPHNGGVITMLMVTGLTHKQAYGDIFIITLLKTLAVFLVIGVYYATGLI